MKDLRLHCKKKDFISQNKSMMILQKKQSEYFRQ